MTIDDTGLCSVPRMPSNITIPPSISFPATPLIYPSIQQHCKHHFLSETLVPFRVFLSVTLVPFWFHSVSFSLKLWFHSVSFSLKLWSKLLTQRERPQKLWNGTLRNTGSSLADTKRGDFYFLAYKMWGLVQFSG